MSHLLHTLFRLLLLLCLKWYNLAQVLLLSYFLNVASVHPWPFHSKFKKLLIRIFFKKRDFFSIFAARKRVLKVFIEKYRREISGKH